MENNSGNRYGVAKEQFGTEYYEREYRKILKKWLFIYFFKTKSGCNFYYISESLETCRKAKDIWFAQFKEYFL